MLPVLFVVFFFKQKTAYEMRISDWSSDVCSSDLVLPHHDRSAPPTAGPTPPRHRVDRGPRCLTAAAPTACPAHTARSTARRAEWQPRSSEPPAPSAGE